MKIFALTISILFISLPCEAKRSGNKKPRTQESAGKKAREQTFSHNNIEAEDVNLSISIEEYKGRLVQVTTVILPSTPSSSELKIVVEGVRDQSWIPQGMVVELLTGRPGFTATGTVFAGTVIRCPHKFSMFHVYWNGKMVAAID